VKQDVDGTTTVYENPLELDAVDAGTEDGGKSTRFRNYGPSVFMVEGDFSMRPGQKPGVGDEAINIGDTHASPFEQFALVFGLQRHLSAEEGVDGFGGSDVLMTRIPVLFVIVIITISSLCIMVGPCSIVGSELLSVDVLEEAEILHGVIGFGMKLVGTL
jgi:hypothetical protein